MVDIYSTQLKDHIVSNWNSTTAGVTLPWVCTFQHEAKSSTYGTSYKDMDRIVVSEPTGNYDQVDLGDDYDMPYYYGQLDIFASNDTAGFKYEQHLREIFKTPLSGLKKMRLLGAEPMFWGRARHDRFHYRVSYQLRAGATDIGAGVSGSATSGYAWQSRKYVTWGADDGLSAEKLWTLSDHNTHNASCTFNKTVHFAEDVVFAKTVSVEEVIIGTPTFDETVTFAKTTVFNATVTGVSHTELDDVGSNTHAQIDTHIGDASDPHGSSLTQTTIIVTNATVTNATVASLEVGTLTGVALEDINNVTSHAAEAGEVLTYDSTASMWEPKAAAGGGGSLNGTGSAGYIAQWSAGTTLTSATVTNTELVDGLMHGSNNTTWVICPYSTDAGSGTSRFVSQNGRAYRNLDGTDGGWVFVLPVPTVKGSLNLYLDAVRVDLYDADAGDYIDRIRVFGVDYDSYDSKHDDNTNYTSTEQIIQTFTATSVAAYNQVHVYINVVVTNASDLQINCVALRGYYA